MGACQKLSKFILFVVNGILLCACIVLIIYLVKKNNKEQWMDLIKNNVPFKVAIGLFGGIILIIIYGFFTPCCSSSIRLIYLIVLFIAIVVEIAAVIFASKYKDKFLNEINKNWERNDLQFAVHNFEKEFECCGFQKFNQSDQCGFDYKAKNISIDNVSTCYQSIKKRIKKNMKGIKYFAIGFLGVEFILFICALNIGRE